jgi:hypothetical protein
MFLIDRLLSDAARLDVDVVAEQVNPSQVRVLAETKDASVLLCRLLQEPSVSKRGERDYQSFIAELGSNAS